MPKNKKPKPLPKTIFMFNPEEAWAGEVPVTDELLQQVASYEPHIDYPRFFEFEHVEDAVSCWGSGDFHIVRSPFERVKATKNDPLRQEFSRKLLDVFADPDGAPRFIHVLNQFEERCQVRPEYLVDLDGIRMILLMHLDPAEFLNRLPEIDPMARFLVEFMIKEEDLEPVVLFPDAVTESCESEDLRDYVARPHVVNEDGSPLDEDTQEGMADYGSLQFVNAIFSLVDTWGPAVLLAPFVRDVFDRTPAKWQWILINEINDRRPFNGPRGRPEETSRWRGIVAEHEQLRRNGKRGDIRKAYERWADKFGVDPDTVRKKIRMVKKAGRKPEV